MFLIGCVLGVSNKKHIAIFFFLMQSDNPSFESIAPLLMCVCNKFSFMKITFLEFVVHINPERVIYGELAFYFCILSLIEVQNVIQISQSQHVLE